MAGLFTDQKYTCMLTEINEMPEKARRFLDHTDAYQLPLGVPYLGMGSSYFAPLAFKYGGINIRPELASEFYNYLHTGAKLPTGVLLSQSGKSSEVLWCSQLFDTYTAICNDTGSPLCRNTAATKIIDLQAGEEKYSSSKTYINTLLALFKGFGMRIEPAVQLLADNMPLYELQGQALADAVYKLKEHNKVNGFYITGSGPNIATALQAALILSESTKLNFNGMALAQYDHGPKETAKASMVIQVLSKGPSYARSIKLTETLRAAGAQVFTVEEPGAGEQQSVLHNIVPFNFMAYHLSRKLEVREIFSVGGKVTEVNIS